MDTDPVAAATRIRPSANFDRCSNIIPLHPCFIRVNLWPEIRFQIRARWFSRKLVPGDAGQLVRTAYDCHVENNRITPELRVLLSAAAGIEVTDKSVPIGVITRTDLINYWAQEK